MLGMLITIAHGSQKAAQVDTGISLLKIWTPDQHLYVRGSIGLAQAQLDQLEQWLDQKGRNWTVLLAKNAHNESFRNAFNRTLTGVDAVEYAIKNRLQANSKFNELRNPQTELLNGAILIIFLEERTFSYFGAEHYSQNGASKDQWSGNLDAAARRAMQNGGRLIDAVKNTVTSIDQRVARTIQSRASRRTAQVARTKAELSSLESHLSTISEKKSAIISKLEGNGGDIARIQVNEMKDKIGILRQRPGTYDISRLSSELNRWEGWLDRYVSDANKVNNLEEQLKKMSASSEEGKASLSKARSFMSQAGTSYRQGSFSYQQLLTNARSFSSKVSLQDQAARRASEKKSFAIKAAGTTGSGLLGLIAIVGNRRRRRIKAEARRTSRLAKAGDEGNRRPALLNSWIAPPSSSDQSTNLKIAGIPATPSTSHAELSAGLTKPSSSLRMVQKIIEEAESLIEPGNPLSRSRNLISRGRYEEAVDLLDAELNVGLKNVPSLKERNRPGEEVDETFSLPIDAWQERTANALNTASHSLDQVEEAWSTHRLTKREALAKHRSAKSQANGNSDR